MRAAAADAGWELPATLAALVTSDERLGRGELAAPLEGGDLTLVLLARPRASFGTAPAALGPTVPWTAAEASVERARARVAPARGGHAAGAGWWWPTSTCPRS